MFSHPIYILAILIFIEGCILYFSTHRATENFFKYLPSMFWIYSLPMIAGTVHIIPNESAVYDAITKWCLPASLVLLLLSVDIKAILHLGKTALAMMTVGAVGIMVGAPIVVLIYKQWLPPDAWMGIGALSASWIGGSANMIAVTAATNTPNNIFLLAVIVDTIVPYLWMGMLVAMSPYQGRFDRWNKSNVKLLDELHARTVAASDEEKAKIISPRHISVMLGIAVAGSVVSVMLAQALPAVKGVVNARAWIIILATFIGIGLSFTPLRRLESHGSSKLGFAMLYFVLASIGATANLANLAAAPVLLLAGITWMIIHGIFLVIGARLLHSPLALAAAASQACVGGTASAPAVAERYQPQLAPVGLLLAVLGNITGTFLGLFTSHLCHLANKVTF
jgi:uncharacterized membrane protein